MADNIKIDYSGFKKEFEKLTKNKFKIDKSLELSFVKNHHAIYVISLILTKLIKNESNENRVIFLTEILSDLLTSTKLAFLGFEIPALVLLRRAIENFYNHTYYFDHSIEYYHLNNGKNEYTPIQELKIYFESHPIFIEHKDELIKEYNTMLFNEYHQLCRVVHTKGADFMNLAICLNDLRNDFGIEEFIKRMINIEIYIIYLIYKFHRNLKYTAIEKKYISDRIPKAKLDHLHQ